MEEILDKLGVAKKSLQEMISGRQNLIQPLQKGRGVCLPFLCFGHQTYSTTIPCAPRCDENAFRWFWEPLRRLL